ncbi:MAG: dihydroxyacetone kinase transcriptional activator DhaS [Lachnospiraceae bacterium]|nr:dihydroxyacetone kinase transcriptional activator DhaS [Lachnospiraceae bacterium]
MPDSNITKKALAFALKELVETTSFSKISVSDICTRCDMNRKSFYYHFKDKYDLVNWIYYTEYIALIQDKEYENGWDLLGSLCDYFFENKNFYRKTLSVEGQNSFSEYFRDLVVSIVTDDLEEIFEKEDSIDFFVDFYADAFVCAIKRWLLQKDCMPAEKFVVLLKRCLLGVSNKLVQDYSTDL